VSATASSTVTGLTNYVPSYFRVAAVNVAGTGAYSSTISVVPGITPGNATPTVANTGNTQIGLTWTIHPTGASSVTDWLVQYSTDNGRTWNTACNTSGSNLNARIVGLQAGVSYSFRVATVNALSSPNM
jgi:hypothetical protein